MSLDCHFSQLVFGFSSNICALSYGNLSSLLDIVRPVNYIFPPLLEQGFPGLSPSCDSHLKPFWFSFMILLSLYRLYLNQIQLYLNRGCFREVTLIKQRGTINSVMLSPDPFGFLDPSILHLTLGAISKPVSSLCVPGLLPILHLFFSCLDAVSDRSLKSAHTA